MTHEAIALSAAAAAPSALFPHDPSAYFDARVNDIPRSARLRDSRPIDPLDQMYAYYEH